MFRSSSNRLLSSLVIGNYGAIKSSTNYSAQSSVRPFSSMRATVKPVSKRKFIPSRAALMLSPNAVSRIKEVLKDQPGAIGLRVTVKQKGCNGLTYHLDYAKEKNKLDEEVVQDGVCVFLDSKALLTLLGTEMDFVETKLSSEFVFKNPNVKGTCGCGESFTI
ncbi:iron-sulfur cluster assembly 1 homolog, mitochondrial [Tetranychus urticae]|uniref:Iron-sulfur cluster assembly 1 homolog, mitochondrial n=1 Tax=Tetranychus urticae TaxID=32264 RepID=T1KU16_TETUR|nr:iron-sulfur cluster assembly 1 homolog, mitochondrial [Tetranychus urticae]